MTSKSFLQKFLDKVEKAGNALPHPAFLFLGLFLITFLISAWASYVGLSAVHPIKKEVITTVNLFSVTGLHMVFTDMVKNFTSFAPLGTVLVAMLGFSVAEKSGLIGVLLKLIVTKSPKLLIIPAVLFASTLSHTAGDVGYVLLIPLAALTFHSLGMNPLAGLAICFAGVSGGFAANLLLSTADPLLSGLSQEGARIIDPTYIVTPLSNWYFMASSTLLIVGVGTLIAKKITIPFLGNYTGSAEQIPLTEVTPAEKKALLWTSVISVLLIAFVLIGLIPTDGYLRDPKADIYHSPFLKGIVAFIFIWGALAGVVFGYVSGTFKKHTDVVKAMESTMSTMAPYLVLVFFGAQFISFFNASNIGLILAVKGSEAFQNMGLGLIPLMIGFIILTICLDLVIGSASAKWALMAPIFVPMFMMLGAAPELTQTAYRIADSVVNIISPLMGYFPLILAVANRYEPKAKVGTLIALMLPYSVGFMIFWCIMLFVWILLKIPVGPGAQLFYQIQ